MRRHRLLILCVSSLLAVSARAQAPDFGGLTAPRPTAPLFDEARDPLSEAAAYVANLDGASAGRYLHARLPAVLEGHRALPAGAQALIVAAHQRWEWMGEPGLQTSDHARGAFFSFVVRFVAEDPAAFTPHSATAFPRFLKLVRETDELLERAIPDNFLPSRASYGNGDFAAMDYLNALRATNYWTLLRRLTQGGHSLDRAYHNPGAFQAVFDAADGAGLRRDYHRTLVMRTFFDVGRYLELGLVPGPLRRLALVRAVESTRAGRYPWASQAAAQLSTTITGLVAGARAEDREAFARAVIASAPHIPPGELQLTVLALRDQFSDESTRAHLWAVVQSSRGRGASEARAALVAGLRVFLPRGAAD